MAGLRVCAASALDTGEVIQGVLSKPSKQTFSHCGISFHQATPIHLSPMVISESHSELRSPAVGTGEEGGLVPTVALPRCQVAASLANWQEKERQK